MPKKNGLEKPIFDYEKIIFDVLQSHSHVWIKKATGLGITEFMLRFMAWLCLKDSTLSGSRKESKKCYESFLKRLGLAYDKNPYEQLLNNGLNIYQDARCGLVHAYGIDRDCKVSLDEAECGICYDQIKDHYDFHIKTYFKDFKNAVNIYIQDLENGTEGSLKLNNALKGRPMIM